MLAALAHRGPDGSGVHVDDRVALGHHRLAIVDLGGGAQPRVDADSGDALTFNGEIYGFRELQATLRRDGVMLRDGSDTEVLFQLIRLYGVAGAVEHIDGMFAFAFRDGRTGTVYLARDRFGEKPLFYGISHGQLVFASEPGAILRHPAFQSATPDLAAAYQLLQFEYLPGQASGWTGIIRLPPASILEFRGGQATVQRYWSPRIGSGLAEPEADMVDRLDQLLQGAVARQLVADVPLGIFLSGGLDSSLLLAIAARQAPGIAAITVRVHGAGYDESGHATEVARHLGVRQEILDVTEADLDDALDAIDTHLSDPLADSSLLPSWMMCRAARRRFTVAIGGDGADELFAGYPNFAVQRLAWIMRLLPPATADWPGAAARRVVRQDGYMNLPFRLSQLGQGFGQHPTRQSYLWMAPFGLRDLPGIWSPEIDQSSMQATAFAEVDAAAVDAGPTGGLDRLLHQFLVTYLPGDILTKTDRAAMFNGLEVRSPYLDRSFASYACSLPSHMKLRGRVRKHALKKLARRYLPSNIVDRPKHGFAVPIGDLLRGSIRQRCEDVLMSRQNSVAPWFDRARIETMLREHTDRTREHGKRLWALYILFTVSGRNALPATVVPEPARPTELSLA